MNRYLLLAIMLSAAFVVASIVLLVYVPSQRLPATVSFVVGVPLTLFTTGLIYLFQKPDFTASPVSGVSKGHLPGSMPDEYSADWVHIEVTNNSIGILGGGTAAGVRCILRFANERTFRPMWATQPNPIQLVTLLVAREPRYALIPDETRFDEVRKETLLPGESKRINVAMKIHGDRNCYIYEPENFKARDLREEKARFSPGSYRFDLTVINRGESVRVGSFVLENEDSTQPESVRVRMG